MTDVAEHETDVMQVLHAVAAHGELNRDELHQQMDGWSKDRLRAALGNASQAGILATGDTSARLVVGPRGRQMLEVERREAAVRPQPAPDMRPALERYRAAAIEGLPAFAELRRRQLAEVEADRSWKATQQWGSVLRTFRNMVTFDQDWEHILDPDPRGLLALRPRFPLPNNPAVYLRITPQDGGLWLRSSAGGLPVWLAQGASQAEIERALGLALLLDPAEGKDRKS